MNQASLPKVPLFPISPPPSSYTFDVRLGTVGHTATLSYTSEHEGLEVARAIRFSRTRAYRYRAESHCTVWHVENCYEELAMVPESSWVQELMADYSHSKPLGYSVSHYIVFVADDGCYEFAAEAAEIIGPGV